MKEAEGMDCLATMYSTGRGGTYILSGSSASWSICKIDGLLIHSDMTWELMGMIMNFPNCMYRHIAPRLVMVGDMYKSLLKQAPNPR